MLQVSVVERVIGDVLLSFIWWTASTVFSIFPSDTGAVIIQEWCVGYAFSTGWNNTDSLFSHVVLMSAVMHSMLERRWVQVIYRWLCTRVIHLQSVSAIVGKFAGWLRISLLCQIACQYSIVLLVIPILCPSHCMILFFQLLDFDVNVVSITLNMENSISRPPFQVPLSSLFVLEVKLYHLFSVCCFLCSSESNFHLESS